MLLLPDTLISATEDHKSIKVFSIDELDRLITFILGLDQLPSNDRFNFIFWSSRDSHSQKMWCPDCEEMKINLEIVLKYLSLNKTGNLTLHSTPNDDQQNTQPDPCEINLVYVYVGHRDQWKSAENPFKKSPWNLTKIPTVLKLSSLRSNSGSEDDPTSENNHDLNGRIVFQEQKLVEEECNDFGKLLQFLSSST